MKAGWGLVLALGLAGCAGTPPAEAPGVAAPVGAAPVGAAGAPAAGAGPVRARLDPDEEVCRSLPPPTGSRISRGEKVCHTRAEWAQIEAESKSATRSMQENGSVSLDKSD